MLPFFFPSTTDPTKDAQPPLLLYNSLSRSKERFTPLRHDFVRLYHCGPTVYEQVHVGTLRAYVFADTLRRVLLLNAHKVMQVMQVTDIGSGVDAAENEMLAALTRENHPHTNEALYELTNAYLDACVGDLQELNIRRPSVMPRASEHVSGAIALIQTLIQKEYAYRTSDGVYFDTARSPAYGRLSQTQVDLPQVAPGAHAEKRSARDVILWKRIEAMGVDSPWGRGIPSLDVVCSTIAMEYLGKELDIHTGSIERVGTHHDPMIAECEAATGKLFAQVWMHHSTTTIEGAEFSTALKNVITLRQLIEHGYNPLSYRYWLLSGHYRAPMNFSFTALNASEAALKRLHRVFAEELGTVHSGRRDPRYSLAFLLAVNDDLDTAKALSLAWEVIKDNTLTKQAKRATLLHFDKVLGLGLNEFAHHTTSAQPIAVRTVAITSEAQHQVPDTTHLSV